MALELLYDLLPKHKLMYHTGHAEIKKCKAFD